MKNSFKFSIIVWSSTHKNVHVFHLIKVMNGKSLRKHSLHGEKTTSVLLKLLISGTERCHTTDAH